MNTISNDANDAQIEWLKNRLAWLQLPADQQHKRDQWLTELGMPPLRTPAQQEEVACFACEDHPKAPNIPCAVCGLHPAPAPIADETRAEIEKLREALHDIKAEAERGNGKFVHLKRVIGLAAARALSSEPTT